MAAGPKSVMASATGASGAAGYTNGVAALNTATALAVTTALAATGYITNTAQTSEAHVVSDSVSSIYLFFQTVTYITSQ